MKVLYYPITFIFYLVNKFIAFIQGRKWRQCNLEILFENMNIDNPETMEEVEEIVLRNFPILKKVIGFAHYS